MSKAHVVGSLLYRAAKDIQSASLLEQTFVLLTLVAYFKLLYWVLSLKAIKERKELKPSIMAHCQTTGILALY